MSKYCVYIVECKDGTFYTGIAIDPVKREATHNAGKGAKYTRGRRPVVLLAHSLPVELADALRGEREVKSLRKREKHRLVEMWNGNTVEV